MPPKGSKIAKACRAMKDFGIAEGQTKAAVKHLLELYVDNWDFIEADNYKELLDFIVPDNKKPNEERAQPKLKDALVRESKRVKSKNKQAPYATTEVIEHPTKRYCTRQQKSQSSSHTNYSESSLRRSPPRIMHESFTQESEESEDSQPLVRKPRQRRINPQEVTVTGNDVDLVPGDCPDHEVSSNLVHEGNLTKSDGCDVGDDVMKYLQVELLNESNSVSVPELSQICVAQSSPVKNALISRSSQYSGFNLPNGEVSQKMMEVKCIKSHRIGECCSMAIATNVNEKKPVIRTSYQGSKSCGLGSLNELFVDQNLIKLICIPKHIASGCFEGLHSLNGIEVKDMENMCGESAKRLGVFKGQHPSQLCNVEAGRTYHSSLKVTESNAIDIDDITRGEERFKITLENGSNAELPPFVYIGQNLIYNKASVRCTVANISDEDCCSRCFGDCLSSSIPCLCVIANGGECAYTPGGLVKEKFLEECISMKREPKKQPYCKKCPLLRLENGNSSLTCKGHFLRRFIKECWYRCGCDKSCGNRIVQKGITVKLQVFLTPEGKGWGLRTLEALPRGAFVCEYVGEIVTIGELHERNFPNIGQEHFYPVLDADWGSHDMLEDEKALGLDNTVYGNVARFINHRCSDATLVEIPVQVETPDCHYYHVALFTTRDVGAMEELTWDYGIAFQDLDNHVKPFRCLCGSPFCRDRNDTKCNITYSEHNDTKRKIIYVRRRRKDGKENKKDVGLNPLAKDLVEGKPRGEIQGKPDSIMQLEVVPSTDALREEEQVAPHASKELKIVPSTGAQVTSDSCMQLQVIPSTPALEPRKEMHYLEWEPTIDSSSSSSTIFLAEEVTDLRAQLEAEKAARKKNQINFEAHRAQFQAVMQQFTDLRAQLEAEEVTDLRAQLEAEKAARKKDQINFEAHRAQFQAVMQQLSSLLPGFQVPQAPLEMQLKQNTDDGSHMSLG